MADCWCPDCDEEIEVGWDDWTITCPGCDVQLDVEYDESYNPETGDESCYWWLKRAEKP